MIHHTGEGVNTTETIDGTQSFSGKELRDVKSAGRSQLSPLRQMRWPDKSKQ